jgi:hypothetical protein
MEDARGEWVSRRKYMEVCMYRTKLESCRVVEMDATRSAKSET